MDYNDALQVSSIPFLGSILIKLYKNANIVSIRLITVIPRSCKNIRLWFCLIHFFRWIFRFQLSLSNDSSPEHKVKHTYQKEGPVSMCVCVSARECAWFSNRLISNIAPFELGDQSETGFTLDIERGESVAHIVIVKILSMKKKIVWEKKYLYNGLLAIN